MSRGSLIAACVAGGLALAGLGAAGIVADLDTADKVASVVGAAAGLLGLALTGYGLALARRAPAGGQSVSGSTVGGRVAQVRNVRGNLRIGRPGPARREPDRTDPDPPASGGSPPPGGQSVTDSRVAGPVHQIDGVGGDAELDR